MEIQDMLKAARSACKAVALLSETERNEILLDLADAIKEHGPAILTANRLDYDRMDADNPFRDRLLLTSERLSGIASDMRSVAALPSPLGKVLLERTMPNGLEIKKISFPYGVVGVIYEARPNVTFDVFSLCFKSGNVCVLKGGSDAEQSNLAIINLIHEVLTSHGLPSAAATLLPSSREAAADLLSAVGLVDVLIPRGGRRLIDFVRDNSRVPCIETGAGVVNTYIDASADIRKATDIVVNAKTRRVSVCNALDCALLHSSRLADLPAIAEGLAAKSVLIHADERAYAALSGNYPSSLLLTSSEDSFGHEFLAMEMAIRTVDSLDEAIEHIARFGSGHSEAIVTEDAASAVRFQNEVDAACVYVNAPTSFTDGAQFGLGAEIGISTQKLGARGPMGLDELCTYKWLVTGSGQTRP